MKKWICLSLLLIGGTLVYSQVGSVNFSGDTLRCKDGAGFRVLRFGENIPANEGVSSVGRFGDTTQLIYIEMMKLAPRPDAPYFFRISFPQLKMECDLRKAKTFNDVYDEICRYGLINQFGLDTNAVVTFEILKGHVSQSEINGTKTRKDSMTADRSVIVPRNTSTPIQIEEEDIVQDAIKIGSYETKITEGPNGKQTQIQIYNGIGALICTATESRQGSGDWRLLTYKDNRFHNLGSSKTNFEGLIKYLIKGAYL